MPEEPKSHGTGLIGFLNSTTGLIIAVTGLVTAVGSLAISLSRSDPPPEPKPVPSPPPESGNWPSPSPPVVNPDTQPIFTAISYCTATGAEGYGKNVVSDNARLEAINNCVGNGGLLDCCSRFVNIRQE